MSNQLTAYGARCTVPSAPYADDRLILMSDVSRDQYPLNDAVHFTNNLQNYFNGDEAAELLIESMFTNWRPTPWILTQQNNGVPFRLCAMQGTFTRDSSTSSTYRIGFYEGKTGYQDFVCNYLQDTSLNDQTAALTYLGNAINEAYLNNMVNILSTAQINNGTDGSGTGQLFNQDDINNYPFGSLIGTTNGLYGILGCMAIGFGTCNYNITGSSVIYIANFALIWVQLDTLANTSHTIFTQPPLLTNPGFQYADTNSDNVRMARLLGLPNDIIIPFAIIDLITNNSLQLTEITTFLNQYSIANNLSWEPAYITSLETSIYQFYYPSNNFTYLFTDFQVPITSSFVTSAFGHFLNNVMANNVSNPDTVSFYDNTPLIKMTQEPPGTASFSGVLLPLNIKVTNDTPIPLNINGTNTTFSRFYPVTQFYNNFGGAYQQGYQAIVRSYISDWLLDNDRLYVMLEDDSTIGFNSVGGLAVPMCALVLALTSNPFGVYSQQLLSSNAVTYNYLVFNHAYNSSPWAQATVTWPSTLIEDYQVSSFMPITYNYQSLNTFMPIAYKAATPSQLTSLSLSIINEVGEAPPPYSFSNKLPFTCFSVQLTRYGAANTATHANYFQTNIPFTSRKPKNLF